VITNTNYPVCPGEPKDSILIFEDTDGDGKADKRTVFYDKLTFASGIAVGFGGVWVGAPPNLLFIPDRNHDDRPDGEPEKVLDGWAWDDTHETLNDFTWGPDGWLYGTQGVFTNSNVGKPGAPDSERQGECGRVAAAPRDPPVRALGRGGEQSMGDGLERPRRGVFRGVRDSAHVARHPGRAVCAAGGAAPRSVHVR
jgi:putative membrane-bound dehydrogenase-like protein